MRTTRRLSKKTSPAVKLKLYQLKVTLLDAKPPIWRRLVVRGDTTLARLHALLQLAMGWYDCHLHTFTIRGKEYSDPNPEWDPPMRDERKVTLTGLKLTAKSRFRYMYDMGDGWDHEILVEAVTEAETMRPPGAVCLAGARACPPEDVGGSWGYERFLKVIRNPQHQEHAEMLEWVGGGFDPEAFDAKTLNEVLGWKATEFEKAKNALHA